MANKETPWDIKRKELAEKFDKSQDEYEVAKVLFVDAMEALDEHDAKDKTLESY